jgi:hypothetical protein
MSLSTDRFADCVSFILLNIFFDILNESFDLREETKILHRLKQFWTTISNDHLEEENASVFII